MTHPSQPLDIPAARAIVDAATPAEHMSMRLDRWIECRDGEGKQSIAEFEREADQEFFFAARTLLPEALAALEEERAKTERLQSLIDDYAKTQPKPDPNGNGYILDFIGESKAHKALLAAATPAKGGS